ncbi:NAD(P)-dependent oxidoreductase [Parabacteroides faecis]|uniref:NAD-dependent epimerase/dehydratase family protein n=1 Tax=Parabacteroides faecis TaxID=1217282 RepID=UPI002164E2A1|nr:NAD(P)-dependent oxidoreductase [Parabacteroides faecis]MCS2892247.1 NAD(P)-dependent oxidoreductase [Parabacteroides faecis]UVQ49113.1 NAD(P)-dependent oxidoreductase [Parabacteroides faecis]
MKQVIVTGANGFIGSSLIKVLVKKDIKVIAIDLSFVTLRLPENNLITKIESDINIKLCEKIPTGEYDAFYHLAWKGVNGIEKTDPIIQLANIQMTIDCAIICKQINCKKLLCAGTIAEQATFSLPLLERTSSSMMYGVAKHCGHLFLESYCKNIGLPFVWMQFSNIYGVGNKTGNLVSYVLNEILYGKVATFGPAEQPYDFIYIDDLVEAVFRIGVTNNSHDMYYIGSGSPRLLKEYLWRIGEITGLSDKIKIGLRPDDGIKYSFEMFNVIPLCEDIGEYVSTTFDDGIAKTLKWTKSLS